VFPPPPREESASSSSDDESMTALCRGPFLVPKAALLDLSASPDGEAHFFTSCPSWEERASSSSDEASGVALRWRPFLVPMAFFSAFCSGALSGAGTSISVRRAVVGSSGSGAGQSIRSAVTM